MKSSESILDANFQKIDYFSIKDITIKIPFYNTNGINVISYTCDSCIDNWDIINNSAKLSISLIFKILYTVNDSVALNILTHKCYSYEIINLPEKIDGFDLYKINIKKKLQAICNIVSLSLLDSNTKYISLSLILLSKLKVSHSLRIIYKINDVSENSYLYASDIFFCNLIQLTFTPKTYEYICFSSYDDTFFYYSNNSIYSYSFSTHKEVSLLTDNLIRWFYNISPNKFIIYKSNINENSILIVDITTNEEIILYKSDGKSNYISFNFSSNVLSFILCNDNGKQLIILDVYSNVLFNVNCEFNNIFMNPSATFILACNDSILEIINITDHSFNSVSIPINNFILNSILFIHEDTAIISGISGNTSYILSLNVKILNFNQLFKGNFTISSIDTDNDGNLILSSNQLGLFNVYILSPGYEPRLSLRLFVNDLYLLIRK